jgi:hypothetical protein
MAFLSYWVWWLLIAALLVTGYVQDVGRWFDDISGLNRQANLEVYHYLFRGVPWFLFRYGGFLRVGLMIGILVLCGWRAALASIAALFLVSFVSSRLSRHHAETMLIQCAAHDFGGTFRLCSGCGVVRPLSYFPLDTDDPAGHATLCVACHHPEVWAALQNAKRNQESK